MKRLALLLLLLGGPTWAQTPQIVQTEDRIELGVGESKTLRFQRPYKSFDSAIPGVIKFLPQSDRQLTVTGTTLGTTLMFIHDDRENVIYAATVSVLPEPGHLVKIYARDVKDFVGFYCTDTGCGRADPDLAAKDQPSSVSVTERVPRPGGGFIEQQKNYNRSEDRR